MFGIIDSVNSCAGIGDLSGNLHAGTNQTWSMYLDSGTDLARYPWQKAAVAYTGAGSAELNAQNALAHSTVDYDIQNITTHVRVTTGGRLGVDQFGWGELFNKGDGNTADAVNSRNGVLLYNGTSYTDETVNAYCNGKSTSVNPCKSSGATSFSMSASNNTIFIGYDLGRFDVVNFSFATRQVGGSVAYTYWNGTTWAALTVTDGTAGFTTSGALTFTPPSAWVRTALSGTGVTTTGAPNTGTNTSQSKFLIRAVISGSPSTYPTVNNIYGDNWLSSSTTTYCAWQQDGITTNACFYRGWRFSTCVSGGVTFSDGTQYCPNPNANSSAHFAHQADYPVYLTELNRVYPNVAATASDGTLLWAWAQSKAIPNTKLVENQNYAVTAVMNDNNGIWPSPGGSTTVVPPWNNGEYSDYPCATWPPTNSCTNSVFYGYWATADAQERSYNHSNYGAGFQTICNVSPGWNNGQPAPYWLQVAAGCDQVLWESFATPFDWSNLNLSNWQAYATTSNFPFGTIAILMEQDTYWDTPVPNGTQAHAFGFGNRSPMESLAGYLLFAPWNGSVNYAAFDYNKSTDYTINNDVQVWNVGSAVAANSTLSSSLAPATCTSTSPCDIFVTADDLVAASGSSYFGTLPVLQICPGNTVASCLDDGDVLVANKIATGHYQIGNNGAGTQHIAGDGPTYATYPAGSYYRFASQAYQGVGSPYVIPSWQNVRYWGSAFPAMALNYGTPDPSGYNGGAPNQTWLVNNAASSLGNCTTGGGTTTGCDPIARRSYVNSGMPVEVLVKTHGSTQDAELETYSPPITLSTLNPRCTPHCVWQQVYADGTLSGTSDLVSLCPSYPATPNVGCMRGAEAMILVTTSVTVTVTTTSLPNGNVGTPYAASLAASGGQPPYTWSVTVGTLPMGISLSSAGVFSGTPTLAGTSSFTVQACDSTTPTPVCGSAPLSITIGQLSLTRITGNASLTGSGSLK
jgi:hypothetical protein